MPYRRRLTRRRRAPKKPLLRRLTATAGRVLKKRYAPRGTLRVGRIARDVAMIKSVINVEKKRLGGTNYTGVLGQVNGGGGGAVMIDITPNLAKGADANQRNGNSVKMTGMYIQGQFIQQSAAIDRNFVSIELWCHKNKEVVMSLSSTGAEIYTASPFSGQIDMVSRRNQDYFSDYVCLKKQRVAVTGDTYSATNILRNATFSFPVKLNRHLRWNDSNTLINGQLFLIMRCQSGNSSTTTASTANIAHVGINTGLNYALDQVTYFVDN